LLRPTGNTCYGLTEWAFWLPDSLVAVETKLAYWREALEQAASYRRAADWSYVALPRPVAEKLGRDAGEFRSRGVGLLAASEETGVSTVIRARRQAHPRRYLLPWVERLSVLRDLANGKEKWSYPSAQGGGGADGCRP
jgi:hypothetical protein